MERNGTIYAILEEGLIGEIHVKGEGNSDDNYFYMKDFFYTSSSKSVEKRTRGGSLNICKWTLMEAAIL